MPPEAPLLMPGEFRGTQRSICGEFYDTNPASSGAGGIALPEFEFRGQGFKLSKHFPTDVRSRAGRAARLLERGQLAACFAPFARCFPVGYRLYSAW